MLLFLAQRDIVYYSQQLAYTQKLENNKRIDSETPQVFTSEDTMAMDTTDIPLKLHRCLQWRHNGNEHNWHTSETPQMFTVKTQWQWTQVTYLWNSTGVYSEDTMAMDTTDIPLKLHRCLQWRHNGNGHNWHTSETPQVFTVKTQWQW